MSWLLTLSHRRGGVGGAGAGRCVCVCVKNVRVWLSARRPQVGRPGGWRSQSSTHRAAPSLGARSGSPGAPSGRSGLTGDHRPRGQVPSLRAILQSHVQARPGPHAEDTPRVSPRHWPLRSGVDFWGCWQEERTWRVKPHTLGAPLMGQLCQGPPQIPAGNLHPSFVGDTAAPSDLRFRGLGLRPPSSGAQG